MPDRELVKKAVAAIKSAADAEFFFDSLSSPDWIPPLEEAGLFRDPPAPVRDVHLMSFPRWPQSRYLARMAPLAGDAVLRVILSVAPTENATVHEDFIDAALAMTPAAAAQLASRVAGWVASSYLLRLPDKAGAFAEHLATGGQSAAALDVMAALLAVQSISRRAPLQEGEEIRFPAEAMGHFHEWQYNEILKKYVPAVVDGAGLRGLELLCGLLVRCIEISRPQEVGSADHSFIWRPAIEDHDQNQDSDVRGHLVSAVRDAAVSLVQKDPTNLGTVIAELEGRRWDVFRRLALYVLRQFPGVSRSLARERLLSPGSTEDVGIYREFWLLARAALPSLDLADQESFMVELDRRVEKAQAEALEAPTVEQREQGAGSARHWLYRRLAMLAESVPSSRLSQFRQLEQEFGPIEYPEFLFRTGVEWVGPTSPHSAQEFSSMSVEELATFLRGWRHTGRRDEATPEGLGRTLSGVVAGDPQRYASEIDRFKNLDPTYVRGLVTGFAEALKAKRSFEWLPVLIFCRWAVEQPRGIPDRHVEGFDIDPDWGWTRKSIAGLLSAGFEAGECQMPCERRIDAWDVLRIVVEDPDPAPDYEKKNDSNKFDPFTISINTVRGEAMHCVIRYALWVRGNLEKQEDGLQRLATGFDEMGEVRVVLNEHLNPEVDSSLAIRAVYGRWFAWLLLLDSSWARNNIGRIFPAEESALSFWEAAWDAHLFYSGTFDNAFDVLTDEYARAIDRMGRKASVENRTFRADDRLAEHLMVFFWRGRIPFDDPTGLLKRFYQRAEVGVRKHALNFIGRSLHGEEKPAIPALASERLQGLWSSRFEATRGLPAAERAAELSEFGWWFASQKLPVRWALDQLLVALSVSGKVEAGHLVIEVLATLASERPFEVVEALTKIVEGDKEDWGLTLRMDDVSAILRIAMKSGNQAAVELATDLVHLLGAKGFRDFGQLLS